MPHPGDDIPDLTSDATAPLPTGPRPVLHAYLLGPESLQWFQMPSTDPDRALAARIGGNGLARFDLLSRVRIWVAGDSEHHLVNIAATAVLARLLADVADGTTTASDTDRDLARMMLALRAAPTVHGACVLTGIGDDGATAALDPHLQEWLTRMFHTGATVHLLP